MFECIIADDEKLAREVLENYISRMPNLSLVAACRDAFEVKTFLENKSAHILFLDIEMPQMTGLDLIRSLKSSISIVLTTAYKEHALEAFDLHVTDYLLKPFSFERFQIAIDKVQKQSSGSNHEKFISVRVHRKMIKIPVDDINYLSAVGNYVKIHLTDRVILTYNTIQNLQKLLPPLQFRQIHRSYIVNVEKVSGHSASTILLGKVELPVGRRFKMNTGNL
jgi:DNA-binding LytR/AlgR family response regulator